MRCAAPALWSGVAGREASAFLADLEAAAPAGPTAVEPEGLAPLLRTLLDETAVRQQRGGPPRLAIYGLIEARLQAADLMVLGGLNEGVVAERTRAPDPWLAPRIRDALGLPGLDRRIGAAAHDFAQGLGAPQVIVTRSRRSGQVTRDRIALLAAAGGRWRGTGSNVRGHWRGGRGRWTIRAATRLIDRPEPVPPASLRPRSISVTEVDRLKADPYAFYARRVLGLMPLDPGRCGPERGVAWHRGPRHPRTMVGAGRLRGGETARPGARDAGGRADASDDARIVAAAVDGGDRLDRGGTG